MQDIYLSFKFCLLIRVGSRYIHNSHSPIISSFFEYDKFFNTFLSKQNPAGSLDHPTTLIRWNDYNRVNKGPWHNSKDDEVQFWETATGTAIWLFERSSFVVFSSTDPNIAALVRSGSIHMLKRGSFKGKTWGGQTSHNLNSSSGAVCTFNSNGETIVMSEDSLKKHLQEHDPNTSDWSRLGDARQFGDTITSVVCCPIKPGLFAVGDQSGGLDIVSNSGGLDCNLKLLHRLNPVDSLRVSACAW